MTAPLSAAPLSAGPLSAGPLSAGPLFGHCVYFTLRDRSADQIQQLLIDCHTYLTGHEGLIFFAAGTLADMHREVNDRAFDVALHTVFCDKAAHDRYQVATRHQEFVARNRDRWAQVRVFDADMPPNIPAT